MVFVMFFMPAIMCSLEFYQRTQSDDGQSRTKHVARSLFKPYVLVVETRLNRVTLKTEVNESV
jgi:NADH:ubiquinone oxidoreductase subunit 6 (subunit J)